MPFTSFLALEGLLCECDMLAFVSRLLAWSAELALPSFGLQKSAQAPKTAHYAEQSVKSLPRLLCDPA